MDFLSNIDPQIRTYMLQFGIMIAIGIAAFVFVRMRGGKLEPVHIKHLAAAPAGLWGGLPAKDMAALLRAGGYSKSELRRAKNRMEKKRLGLGQSVEDRQEFMLLALLASAITVVTSGGKWGGYDIEDADFLKPERKSRLDALVRAAAKGDFAEEAQKTATLYNVVRELSIDPEREATFVLSHLSALCDEILADAPEEDELVDALDAVSRYMNALALRAPKKQAAAEAARLQKQAAQSSGPAAGALGGMLGDILRTIEDRDAAIEAKRLSVQLYAEEVCNTAARFLPAVFSKDPLMNTDVAQAQGLMSTLVCLDATGSFPPALAASALEEFCGLVNRASDDDVGTKKWTPASRMREAAENILRGREAKGYDDGKLKSLALLREMAQFE